MTTTTRRFFSEALPSRAGVTEGDDVRAPDTVETARHPKPGSGWTESMKGMRARIDAEHEPSGRTKGHLKASTAARSSLGRPGRQCRH
jgi:hypothetical protein